MKSAGSPKRGARRSLFGSRCSERIDGDFRQLEKKEIQEASARWGYDFAADRPLSSADAPDSQYSWEPVAAKHVPRFYRSKKAQRAKRLMPSTPRNKKAISTRAARSLDNKVHKTPIKKSPVKAPVDPYVIIKRTKDSSPKKIRVMGGAHAYNTRSMVGMRTRSSNTEDLFTFA
ncbi:Oidioi.mRNA.OKI2018_I69.XSR.g15961.t1.cds [Oikopleura dioica]|uniref:Oidioi.mRNA.OKI2018_I69.XSR.g15961.t1.cds n=1 Tax=Oikopleura dioica TaxID=34765 RepID=A0ABN7SJN4_OIKDI|nr:Oidioi.mRNA.OKI2018_I69.XSR.g15961.t1.cds [Oikopleura dioica]